MGLLVGRKSAGRCVLRRFSLCPAAEHCTRKEIFYRKHHISIQEYWRSKIICFATEFTSHLEVSGPSLYSCQ